MNSELQMTDCFLGYPKQWSLISLRSLPQPSFPKTAYLNELETFQISFRLQFQREDQNIQTFHTGTEIKHKDVEFHHGISNKHVTLD